MAKSPRRPDPTRLLATEADARTLERGTRLHRIYSRGGDHPTRWSAFRSFGPLRSRFDHHLVDPDGSPHARGRSILYAALDLPSAFAEVFQAERRIDRRRRAPWLASFDVGVPLRLLDLCGGFPLRAGASMKLVTDSVLDGAALVARLSRDVAGDRRGGPSVLADRSSVRRAVRARGTGRHGVVRAASSPHARRRGVARCAGGRGRDYRVHDRVAAGPTRSPVLQVRRRRVLSVPISRLDGLAVRKRAAHRAGHECSRRRCRTWWR